jgi:hypothetical protein
MSKKLSIDNLLKKSKPNNNVKDTSIDVLEDRRRIVEEFRKNQLLEPQKSSIQDSSDLNLSQKLTVKEEQRTGISTETSKIRTQSEHSADTSGDLSPKGQIIDNSLDKGIYPTRRARLSSNEFSENPDEPISLYNKTPYNENMSVEKKHTSIVDQSDINQISEQASNKHQSDINHASKSISNKYQSNINHASNINQNSINDKSKVDQKGIKHTSEQKNELNHTSEKMEDIKHTSNADQSGINQISENASGITSNVDQSEINHKSLIDHNMDQNIHQNIHQNFKGTNTKSAAYEATTLHGYQLNIFGFLLKQCRENGAFFTKRLSIDFIKQNIGISKPAIRLAIQRLKEKNLVLSRESKGGRGGWTVYEIPHSIFKEIGKLEYYTSQSADSIHTSEHTSKYISEHTSMGASKLVSNFNNTNNTKDVLIYDFNASDCDLSVAIHIGVGEKAIGDSLRNLTKKLKLYPDVSAVSKDEFQEFINKFVEYASSENGKGIKNMVAMFVSEFEKFQLTGSCSTTEWHNDKDFAQIEQYVKQQEAERKRRQEFIEKALDYKFEEWVSKINQDELLDLVPESQFVKFGGAGYQMELKNYFRKNIWEEVRKEMKA